MPQTRRTFLIQASTLSLTLPLLALPVQASEAEVTPNEDLMREHGLLRRIALIYDENAHLAEKGAHHPDIIHQAAKIVRNFVENYHEQLEEDFLFPALRKANREVELVKTLGEQHEAGRKLTDRILELSGKGLSAAGELSAHMRDFVFMYRAHAAREDTVLFPAFREVVGEKRYHDLGEEFEERERKLFGKEGFENVLAQVTNLEKQMGIHDLKRYTPKG